MEKPILNLISVFGWNGPYIVSCCNAMFGTENFVLVQNLVEDIKILNLRYMQLSVILLRHLIAKKVYKS